MYSTFISLLVDLMSDDEIPKEFVVVPCPVNDDVCPSELSFLNHSGDERNVPEDFVFVSGPRF